MSKIVYSPGLSLSPSDRQQLVVHGLGRPANRNFQSIPPYSGIIVLLKWSGEGAHYVVFARDGYNPNAGFDANSCYLLDAQRAEFLYSEDQDPFLVDHSIKGQLKSYNI